MDIAIDFDGTVVKHKYPDIGEDIGAEPVLNELVQNGHNLILNTMRSGKHLISAISWFNLRKIPLYGHNAHPTQHTWTESPKVYANMYIDDMALGIPLVQPLDPNDRPYVDWVKVRIMLVELGHLQPK